MKGLAAATVFLAASPFASLAEDRKIVSLAAIVADLNAEHDKTERDKIFESPSKTITFQIRAKYELWNPEKQMAIKSFFEKQGMTHPDFITGCICEAWKLSHEEGKFDEKQLLRKHAAMEKQWRKWNKEMEARGGK